MGIALVIIAVIGLLLFIWSYLKLIITGLKQHPVTGIIAAIPILNILVMPSLFDRVGKLLIAGFVGLLVAVGAWYIGAEQGLGNLLTRAGFDSPNATQLVKPESFPVSGKDSRLLVLPNQQAPDAINKAQPGDVDATDTVIRSSKSEGFLSGFFKRNKEPDAMPIKPLYQLKFQEISLDNLSMTDQQVVKIRDKNQNLIEGRVMSVNSSMLELILSGNGEQYIVPVSNINSISMMIKSSGE